MLKVILLEPRTPRQPGKLQKLSKNEYVFTLSIYRVKQKAGIASAFNSMNCTRFTGECSEYCAQANESKRRRAEKGTNFPATNWNISVRCQPRSETGIVVKIAWENAYDEAFR
jgi:putative component of membrane protein insertase Oxa1/YidC/SpoIIIJ protein YidD